MSFLTEFTTNQIFLTGAATLILTQFAKIIFDLLTGRRMNKEIVFRMGGMPSSHAAFVSSMTGAVYFVEGLSTLFFLAMGFSLIVMGDAYGVRKEVGIQGRIVNLIVKQIRFNLHRHNLRLLKEFVGHSRLQVFVGAVLGVAVAALVNVLL